MTRAEHLAWAKARALEYVVAGDIQSAISSMVSDLNKHPELERHIGIVLAPMGSRRPDEVRRWIEGFA